MIGGECTWAQLSHPITDMNNFALCLQDSGLRQLWTETWGDGASYAATWLSMAPPKGLHRITRLCIPITFSSKIPRSLPIGVWPGIKATHCLTCRKAGNAAQEPC